MNVPHPYNKDYLLAYSYKRGWDHGHGIACHNMPTIGHRINKSVDYVGCGDYVTANNIREYHGLLCHAAESNSRQYSPFEFTAHEFNESEYADGLWEAFDAGIAASIAADLAAYTDEGYGIIQNEVGDDN